MTLPELALQVGYGRIGWAIVASATLLHLWPAARTLTRQHMALVLALALIAAMLPGQASYAFWLGLACQYPSGLLVGCCAATIWARMAGERARYQLPLSLVIALPPLGALLYLDALGLLTHGYFFWGFSEVAAPALALLGTVACLGSIATRGARPATLALFISLGLFTLLRLPSGNLWDALLDPLLWGWSCVALVSLVRRKLAQRSAAVPALAPAAT